MNWVKRSSDYTLTDGESGFSISFAGMNFSETDLENLNDKFSRAVKGIADIENGMIKNPDENRKVTHFTDRLTYISSAEFREVEEFSARIRSERAKLSAAPENMNSDNDNNSRKYAAVPAYSEVRRSHPSEKHTAHWPDGS